jgi:hypothetical protein
VDLGSAERRLLAEMPLHAITSVHGEAGPRQRLAIETVGFPARAGNGPGRRSALLSGYTPHLRQLGQRSFDALALQLGHVMIQLVRQRRQRPATRPAPHDLPHQVISQRRCVGPGGADTGEPRVETACPQAE